MRREDGEKAENAAVVGGKARRFSLRSAAIASHELLAENVWAHSSTLKFILKVGQPIWV